MINKHLDPFSPFKASESSHKGSGLDWEESALDSQSEVEGFTEEVRTTPRLSWLQISVFVACCVLALKLFDLQVMQGQELKELAEGNRLRIHTILAPRGYILDRNDEPIARNTASFGLVATPVDLPTEGLDGVIDKISSMFSIPKEEISEKLKNIRTNSTEPIVIARNITQQQSILFETHAQEMVGFSLRSVPIREYTNPEIFSHALGYTGLISESELTDLKPLGYQLNDFVGKSGIELSYEQYLRGQNGNTQVEVDAMGRPIKSIGTVEPEPGNIVKLNIDAGLQQQLYEGFTKISPESKGAAVAMNPKTGEVLALVSVPGFNNNLFAPGISQNDYKQLIENPNLPLFNRAVAGVYPPGSTIKGVIAAAALEENIVKPDTIINDNGIMTVVNQFNPGIVYRFPGWKLSGLGPMNVRSAIAESSDIYFYTVGGGNPSTNIDGLGIKRLVDYYRSFGMGELTGIDIQGEKTGTLASPEWKAEYHKNDPVSAKWYLGNTYHISIGQGDMLATPLQVNLWTSIIANNGWVNKPTLLKEVVNQAGETVYKPTPELLLKTSISPENMAAVQAGYRDNIISEKGSGRTLANLPITSAGKTGTSQFDGSDPKRTHAWYTVYAPYENPEIAITVLVEAGGEGHAAAVPIVREALLWWAQNRHNK